MSKSESKTLNLLEKKRSILKPLLKEYKGTFVKEIGDGTLSYFESAVNAATCAVKLQEKTYDDKEMNIRVGIHIGDIVFKDGDVFGGGVNVASRLESIAPAGGVCVSKSVYDELSNQDDFDGIELGLQSLKGIGRLIEVYGLKGDKLNEPDPKNYGANYCGCHSDDEVPSIVILPFKNKGKEEDEYYSYGIWLDLITEVSGAGLIRVANKQQIDEVSDLSYKEIPKKLCVRYIVTGELWKIEDNFQLFIELYDTKESKVVWTDKWQESWNNLTTIKGNLLDGILKALDTKPSLIKKMDVAHINAYEYYLRAKYKYEKRESTEDIEIARGLLEEAIELDSNFILSKDYLAIIIRNSGDYEDAMRIFKQNLKQSEELGDLYCQAKSLIGIGKVYWERKLFDKAMDYYNRSLSIFKSLNDKPNIAHLFDLIGHIYEEERNFKNTLLYWKRSKQIYEEIEDEDGILTSITHSGRLYLHSHDYGNALEYFLSVLEIERKFNRKADIQYAYFEIGALYNNLGDYDSSLDFLARSIDIIKKFDDKKELQCLLSCIGIVYLNKGNYNKAVEQLEKSLGIQKEIGLNEEDLILNTTTNLYLAYKYLGKEYDEKEIHNLLKDTENIEFDLNYRLYQLLENTSYLETAYKQVQENADNLEPDVAAKFLSYPIPKAIVEEWEKVK